MKENKAIPVDNLPLPHAWKLFLNNNIIHPDQSTDLRTGKLTNTTGKGIGIRPGEKLFIVKDIAPRDLR